MTPLTDQPSTRSNQSVTSEQYIHAIHAYILGHQSPLSLFLSPRPGKNACSTSARAVSQSVSHNHSHGHSHGQIAPPVSGWIGWMIQGPIQSNPIRSPEPDQSQNVRTVAGVGEKKKSGGGLAGTVILEWV